MIQIEPKYPSANHTTSIVKRLGRSTDDGDAVLNAWYSRAQPDVIMDFEIVEKRRMGGRRGWA